MFLNSQHFEGKGACWSFEMGTGMNDKQVNYSHKPNNKLVNAQLEHFLCTNEPHVYTNSKDSSWPRLGGSHHLPPYSIFCYQPRGLHPNVIFSQDSQVESPEISKIGTFGTLKSHNFLCTPLIEIRSEAKLQPLSRYSHNMWHNT